MKRSFVLILTLASGMILSASAQTPAAATPVEPAKIAVISFQAALAQTNEGQRTYAELKKKYEPKRTEFKNLSDEVDTLTKQLQAQGASLNDAERASRVKTVEDKKKKAQRFGEDAQNEFQQEMQQMYSGLASKVYDVLAAYAKQQGYTLVLDVSETEQQAPLALYASPSTDITKIIVDAYNTKSGIAAPPATPAATAPKPAPKPAVAH